MRVFQTNNNNISYKDRVTNEHVRKTIVKHIGPYEDLLATVKRRKLKWYGHVTRSDGLTKVILQGTVEGSRRRGRQKKSWSDNIAEWTGKSFAETQAMAHNRQEWRGLTRKPIMTRPYGSSRSYGTKARQGSYCLRERHAFVASRMVESVCHP